MKDKWSHSTIRSRFWKKVVIHDGCWAWKGKKHQHGYGLITWRGKRLRANRVAWRIFFGKIPPGIMVCHACDNPPCVRPDHLFLGRHRENVDDMIAKGRVPRGADRAFAKLTDEIVMEIRGLWTSKTYSQHQLAKKYLVSQSTISRIVRAEDWSHLV